jgi:hypothetical protein
MLLNSIFSLPQKLSPQPYMNVLTYYKTSFGKLILISNFRVTFSVQFLMTMLGWLFRAKSLMILFRVILVQIFCVHLCSRISAKIAMAVSGSLFSAKCLMTILGSPFGANVSWPFYGHFLVQKNSMTILESFLVQIFYYGFRVTFWCKKFDDHFRLTYIVKNLWPL